MTNVCKDLHNERGRTTFNVEELTNILDCGAKLTEKRRNLEKTVFNVKGFRDEIPEEYLSHKEKYENAIRKAVLLYQCFKSFDNNILFADSVDENLRNVTHAGVFKENSPLLMHFSMFLNGIKIMANEKQQKHWLNRVKNMEIIGTYAQIIVEYENKPREYISIDPSPGACTGQTLSIFKLRHLDKLRLLFNFTLIYLLESLLRDQNESDIFY